MVRLRQIEGRKCRGDGERASLGQELDTASDTVGGEDGVGLHRSPPDARTRGPSSYMPCCIVRSRELPSGLPIIGTHASMTQLRDRNPANCRAKARDMLVGLPCPVSEAATVAHAGAHSQLGITTDQPILHAERRCSRSDGNLQTFAGRTSPRC